MRSIRLVIALALLAATLTGCGSSHGSGTRAADHTLAIVGTSDIADSNLFAAVLKPGFEKAYPQYTVTYQGNATAQAMAFAKTGQFSALIVHAASLENQFVADGFSTEPYGRAIFWGDFVLLGPKNDPAGVMSGGAATADPAAAFAKIAAAGAAGKAHFIARETGAGTDVTSHKIWATTTGVATCAVSTENGGGAMPSTASGDCDTSSPAYPSWYTVTGAKQGANVQYADVCSPASGAPDCYVFTDRGTYDYLASTGALSTVRPVVEGDSGLLVNSFHAYAINPDAVPDGSKVNSAAATAFLDWITSPTGQKAVGSYLAETGDAPFRPDAAPVIRLDATVRNAIAGTLANVVPGTPPLSGQKVTLEVAGKPVASALTDAQGRFSIAHARPAGSDCALTTGPITQVEDATLHPAFGDLLQPAVLALCAGAPTSPSARAEG